MHIAVGHRSLTIPVAEPRLNALHDRLLQHLEMWWR